MKKKELENILKAEIVLTARKLISAADNESFDEVSERFDRLYEKISAYRYLKSSGEQGWEAIFTENKPEEPAVESETNKGKESLSQPASTIEQQEKKLNQFEAVKSQNKEKSNPLKAHADIYKKAGQTKFKPKNPHTAPFSIGIADKIALVINLFDNDSQAFDEFIQRINMTESYDEALELVHRMKETMNWTGKDEYEFRLIQLIQAKFS